MQQTIYWGVFEDGNKSLKLSLSFSFNDGYVNQWIWSLSLVDQRNWCSKRKTQEGHLGTHRFRWLKKQSRAVAVPKANGEHPMGNGDFSPTNWDSVDSYGCDV